VIVTVEKFIIALQSHKMVMCVSKFMTMTQLSGRQTSMRVVESCHALLQGAFEALDERNKGLKSVPTMF
jgi:hypothetical protein